MEFPGREVTVSGGVFPMRLSTAMAMLVAGVLLVALLSGRAEAGWFGIGGSGKSSEANKKPKTDYYDPNLIASGNASKSTNKQSSGGLASLFGFGKPASGTSPSKKPVSSTKGKKPSDKGEGNSWWNSWFKPKEPPPPKNTGEWMKLKPIRW